MKGIYLTEEGKQEIEARIDKLNKNISNFDENSAFLNIHYTEYVKEKQILLKLLDSAIILPVKENLKALPLSVLAGKQDIKDYYPNGVIIQSKK